MIDQLLSPEVVMDEERSQELAEELAEEVRESEKAGIPDEIPEEMKSDARPWGPADYDEHGGAGLDPTAAARPADDCIPIRLSPHDGATTSAVSAS